MSLGDYWRMLGEVTEVAEERCEVFRVEFEATAQDDDRGGARAAQ